MKQIVFIIPQLSQPRCIKRITAVYNAGIPCKVFGFDNGLYSENIKTYPIEIDGVFKNDKKTKIGRYLYPDLKVRDVIRKYRKDSVFYLFGAETAAKATKLFGVNRYIYEEADISSVNKRNALSRKIWTLIDKSVIKNSLLTVFTSGGFVKYYFGEICPENILLLPNKLHSSFINTDRKDVAIPKFDVNHIKFSFIGSIRYPNTIIRFAKVIGKNYPQHEFHFWGNDRNNPYLDDEIRGFENVFFHGPFSNPQDLKSIYETVDINVVCYDPSFRNVLIAEPNKLYESLFFLKPMVVSAGTFLEKEAVKYGIGKGINATSNEDISQYIESVSQTEVMQCIEKAKRVPVEDLLDDEMQFVNKLKSIVQ